MTEYLLSIDPGLSSALALLSYDDDSAPVLEAAWQFGGGVAGLLGWLSDHWDGRTWDGYNDEPKPRGFYSWTMGLKELDRLEVDGHTEYNYDSESEDDWAIDVPGNTTVIAEKFTARNTRGFSYTTASLEPLRCEGALIALGLMPDYTPKEKRWRDPGLQYLAGGKDKADKKRRMHRFLKDNGYYRTGKDFGTADADDFRSACAHGINYLIREVKHTPSYQLVVDWLEKEGEK